jgi:hypothetical protein
MNIGRNSITAEEHSQLTEFQSDPPGVNSATKPDPSMKPLFSEIMTLVITSPARVTMSGLLRYALIVKHFPNFGVIVMEDEFILGIKRWALALVHSFLCSCSEE